MRRIVICVYYKVYLFKNNKMKGKEDHEYMLNILLKENEKYRNTLKEQSNNKSETIYGTILAMLDVLSIQRNKIDSIEKGT